ncbi:MAG: S-ribosylhomocysteine lyase, partial [Bacteroidales bacterium]|nr:S-ribosylhomocysteine lyase [Bacteroidales bacterium]
MEVIQSFTIDHTQLKPGIYVSRVDKGFTTFDLRITEPNKEPAVAPAAMHSMEHLMATWFRNSAVKDDVVYVGPMGCLTGM